MFLFLWHGDRWAHINVKLLHFFFITAAFFLAHWSICHSRNQLTMAEWVYCPGSAIQSKSGAHAIDRAWQINGINWINDINEINDGLINLCKLGLGLMRINDKK